MVRLGFSLAAIILLGFAPQPKAYEPAAPARDGRNAPSAALLFPSSELPGSYYFGDGLGVNCSLTLTAEQRFGFTWRGCLGVYDRNEGKWRLDGDEVILEPEKPNRHEGFQGVNVRFVPAKWGNRLFLVDEYEMPAFCAGARGAEPPITEDLHGDHYARYIKPDHVFHSGEGPLVPTRYRDYYRLGPIKARVTGIRPDGTVLLDKGDQERVKPGLLLVASGWRSGEVRVISTNPSSSIARPSYYWNSERRIQVGDELTTGAGWMLSPRGTGWPRYANPPEKPNAAPAREKPGPSSAQ